MSCYFLVGSFQFSILPDSGGLSLLFAPPVLARRALRAYCLAPLLFLGRGCRAVPVLLEGGFVLSPAPPFLVVGSPQPSPSPFVGVVTPLPFPLPGHCAKNLAMGEVPSSLLLPCLLPLWREGGGQRGAGLRLLPSCKTSSSRPGLLPGKRVSGWVRGWLAGCWLCCCLPPLSPDPAADKQRQEVEEGGWRKNCAVSEVPYRRATRT